MGWHLSASGHFDDKETEEKFLAELRDLCANWRISYLYISGQYVGQVQLADGTL